MNKQKSTSNDNMDPKLQMKQLEEMFSHQNNNSSKVPSRNEDSSNENNFRSEIKKLFLK